MRLAAQPADQRSVRHGPLVLVPEPRKFHAPAIDRDRTVSRRSEPSSRATLMGEQPNPWDLLQAPLCHCTHRPVTDRPEGTFGSLRYAFGGDHPSQTARQAVYPAEGVSARTNGGPYFNDGSADAGAPESKPPAYPTHRVPRRSAKLQ